MGAVKIQQTMLWELNDEILSDRFYYHTTQGLLKKQILHKHACRKSYTTIEMIIVRFLT